MVNRYDPSYVHKVLDEIDDWKKREPTLKKLQELVGSVGKGVGRLIPKKVEELVIGAITNALNKLAWATGHALDEPGVRQRLAKNTRELGDGFQAADEAAKFYWNCGVAEAAAEGGATGAAGGPGLVVDIPLLFGIMIRTVQQMALCYGIDPTTEQERAFVLKVLNCSTSESAKKRIELVAAAKQLEQAIGERMIRKVAQNVGVRLARRKAVQLVPFAGGVVGLAFNAMFVNEVCKAAYMMYRERFIDRITAPTISDPEAAVAID